MTRKLIKAQEEGRDAKYGEIRKKRKSKKSERTAKGKRNKSERKVEEKRKKGKKGDKRSVLQNCEGKIDGKEAARTNTKKVCINAHDKYTFLRNAVLQLCCSVMSVTCKVRTQEKMPKAYTIALNMIPKWKFTLTFHYRTE